MPFDCHERRENDTNMVCVEENYRGKCSTQKDFGDLFFLAVLGCLQFSRGLDLGKLKPSRSETYAHVLRSVPPEMSFRPRPSPIFFSKSRAASMSKSVPGR